MRTIEPTPLDSSPAPQQAPSPPTTAPSPTPHVSGKRPWERFGPVTLDFRPLTVGGIELQVTRVPAFALYNGVTVYPPFTAIDKLDYADAHDLMMLTAEVLDAVRAASWWHAPITTGYSTSGDMQSDGVVIDHGHKWQIAMQTGNYDGEMFAVNIAKDWIADKVALSKPGYGVNRGYWMTERAKTPIQQRGQAHSSTYTDVAQCGWFVRASTAYLAAIENGSLGNAPFRYADYVAATRNVALHGSGEDILNEADFIAREVFDAVYGTAYQAVRGIGNLARSGWQWLTSGNLHVPDVSIPTGREPIAIKAWPGNEHWSDSDIRAFVDAADKAGVNPADVLLVHLSETGGGDPAHWIHPDGNAAGIMQWTRSTAKAMHYDLEDIKRMPISAQIPVVDTYLQKYIANHGVRDAADIYMINYTGGLCRTDTCTPKAGSPAYDLNKVLDRDKDGDVDLADLRSQMQYVKRIRWDSAPTRIVK